MKTHDFVHLALDAAGGEIKGRTKLQKTVFFLGILTGHLDDLGYRPHFYGPYSDTVATSVNGLKSLGFVEESTASAGTINSRGFEIARHDFRLTEEGRKVAEQKQGQFPEDWKQLSAAVGTFKAAGDLDYMKMSVAAKAFFLLKSKGASATAKDLSESAAKLGWNPTPEEITESIGFLEKLALVSAKPK